MTDKTGNHKGVVRSVFPHSVGMVRSNGHAEQSAPLSYDCPPWLPGILSAIAMDDQEPIMVQIEAIKLLSLINHWYEPDEDDFPIAEELTERIHRHRADYELAVVLGEIADSTAK